MFFLMNICFCSFSQTPTITSFTPLSAKPGDAVTITGTGFNTTTANNIVFFGATMATVTVSTATSITATVPTGATYAPVTVLNTGTVLTAYSLANFNPIYAPVKTSITATDFDPKQDYTTLTNTVSVAIGDLDGDGKPDLVVANYTSSSISVFRNTSTSGSIGAGSYAAKVDFTTRTNPFSIAIGDLDGDGKPDLAVANNGSARVSVFRNTSSIGTIDGSSFAAKVDFTTGNNPYSVAIGDLDGDGKPELAVTNTQSTSVSVFRNTSSSGTIDLSSFAAKVDFVTGVLPRSVTIGDLDGDGKPDLAVANSSSTTVSVFRNTSTSGSIVAGSFAAKVDFITGAFPTSIAIGDLDGDGKPDLAITNQNSVSVSVFHNTSSIGTITGSSFAPKVDFTTQNMPRSVSIGDLDGDGKPDLAVANYGSNSVSVFRNTSTSGSIVAGSFEAKVDYTTLTQPNSVAIGDLDRDSKPDLAVAYLGSASVSVLRNADMGVLPLSFIKIDAIKEVNRVGIRWEVGDPADGKKYIVTRSSDGISFKDIGFVAGSNLPSYHLVDTNPLDGINLYRIKAVAQSGQFIYSDIVKALFGSAETEITIYPNPVTSNRFTVSFENQSTGLYDVSIYDMRGLNIYSAKFNHSGSFSKIEIVLPRSVAKGTYQLRIVGTDKISKVSTLMIADSK